MGKASRRRTTRRESARETRSREGGDQPAPFVARPFQGLPGETEWVALREVVPAATATVRLTKGVAPDGAVETATIATVLPLAWSGMRRTDGDVMVAMQSGSMTGDASRDIAQVLLSLAAAEPGTTLPAAPQALATTPRLQDVLDLSEPFTVTMHQGFDFWIADTADLDEEAKASLERANQVTVPTTRLESIESGYWCRIGERTHLRWILPHDEDAATDALSRLHAKGASSLGQGTRLLGAFRACGLLVPVWDLDPALEAEDYESASAATATRLGEALADSRALSADERRARSGLLSRQITLR